MFVHRFRKKPVVIEAVRLVEGDETAIAKWCGGQTMNEAIGQCASIEISTLEGTMTAEPGDYIIRGVQGEFYPCKPDIFAQTYEPVDS